MKQDGQTLDRVDPDDYPDEVADNCAAEAEGKPTTPPVTKPTEPVKPEPAKPIVKPVAKPTVKPVAAAKPMPAELAKTGVDDTQVLLLSAAGFLLIGAGASVLSRRKVR